MIYAQSEDPAGEENDVIINDCVGFCEECNTRHHWQEIFSFDQAINFEKTLDNPPNI